MSALGTTVARAQSVAVTITAPDGTNNDDLGVLFDARFQPLSGSLRPAGVAPEVRPLSRTDRETREEMTTTEVSASASVWGIGADIASDSSRTYGYMRAFQHTQVVQMPRSATLSEAPAGAAYYLSRIWYGRMIEVRFGGTRDAVRAHVRALTPEGATGGVAGGTETDTAYFHAVTLGLQERIRGDLAALAATSVDDLVATYQTGDPVPILVELAPIPAALRPVAVGPERVEIRLISISFPASKPDTTPWDVFGGLPDMAVRITSPALSAPVQIAAPANRSSYDLPGDHGQLIGSSVVVSQDSPLSFDFWDIDPLDPDPAGTVTITHVDLGRRTIETPVGTRAVIDVIAVE
jgi:hypothetical protein